MGYSEPGTGSDLASLACRGELIEINTESMAAKCGPQMPCTATTFCSDSNDIIAPRHEGSSLILVDMDQPGVEVSPIRLISGESPLRNLFQ